MLCDHLEGWDREGGREGDARGKRYGNICVCITDSLCYKSETNTPLESNYTPIKMLKKKRNKGSPRDLWVNIKHTNILIIGVPKEEEKEKLPEKILGNVIVKNLNNKGKEIVTHVREVKSPMQEKSKA